MKVPDRKAYVSTTNREVSSFLGQHRSIEPSVCHYDGAPM